MPSAKLPGTMRNPYISDERTRKENEVLEGILIGLATLAGSLAFVLVYLFIRDYHA